jgi:hypothetical protein
MIYYKIPQLINTKLQKPYLTRQTIYKRIYICMQISFHESDNRIHNQNGFLLLLLPTRKNNKSTEADKN